MKTQTIYKNKYKGLTTLLLFMGLASQASVNVIGGQEVNNSDSIARRTVALIMISMDQGKKGMGICSGSLIDSTHVLTAAHCITGFQYGYVVFSNTNAVAVAQAAHTSGAGQAAPISSVKAMPGYGGQTGGGAEFPDFAIITFFGAIPAGYEPAHFLTAAGMAQVLKKGQTVTLAGYGITSAPQPNSTTLQGAGTLRRVDVSLVGLSPKKIDLYLSGLANHIACEGDSGGPAMVAEQGQEYVIGVDSRGDCKSMAIYTLVTQEMVQQFVEL